jgi:hypothetical protein
MVAKKRKPKDQLKRSGSKKKAGSPKIYVKSKVRSLSSKKKLATADVNNICDCDPVHCACWEGKCGCDSF